ncbi:hypothetical protein EVAR_87404_1 [Eumeta japonica]|uniref:Uncharacterized protein n=1 Tax=Eumeta variegata TaxID=151549 RepID=A0A4C1XJ62_EUMVA|nr:hypothetical protein EVAR_87404_1 [Eumeta japonica]
MFILDLVCRIKQTFHQSARVACRQVEFSGVIAGLLNSGILTGKLLVRCDPHERFVMWSLPDRCGSVTPLVTNKRLPFTGFVEGSVRIFIFMNSLSFCKNVSLRRASVADPHRRLLAVPWLCSRTTYNSVRSFTNVAHVREPCRPRRPAVADVDGWSYLKIEVLVVGLPRR